MKFTSGLPETACGLGSTLKTTENLRSHLPALLSQCEIRTLIDAPCGDANWISRTDLHAISYHGCDSSVDNLRAAIGRPWPAGFRPQRCTFECADILTTTFQMADAILCRDFFQHLTTADVEEFLEDIENDGFSWMLATSFDNERNEELGPEMFRPLNLSIAPFDLGTPEFAIADPPGSGRILGAWRL